MPLRWTVVQSSRAARSRSTVRATRVDGGHARLSGALTESFDDRVQRPVAPGLFTHRNASRRRHRAEPLPGRGPAVGGLRSRTARRDLATGAPARAHRIAVALARAAAGARSRARDIAGRRRHAAAADATARPGARHRRVVDEGRGHRADRLVQGPRRGGRRVTGEGTGCARAGDADQRQRRRRVGAVRRARASGRRS